MSARSLSILALLLLELFAGLVVDMESISKRLRHSDSGSCVFNNRPTAFESVLFYKSCLVRAVVADDHDNLCEDSRLLPFGWRCGIVLHKGLDNLMQSLVATVFGNALA